MAFYEIKVFTPDECHTAVEILETFRKYWISIPGKDVSDQYMFGRGLYTCGYEMHQYLLGANHFNSHLLRQFSWLYNKVFTALEKVLGLPIQLTTEAGYPGFHIFESALPRGGMVHFDLQQNFFPWTDKSKYDFSCPLSFTVALEVPSEGAALNYWPNILGIENTKPIVHSEIGTPEKIQYRLGYMYFFNELFLHQIGKKVSVEKRVTLQGHGLKFDQKYWSVYF